MDPRGRAVLTIGQLAAFAGVTVRAVRHYHARGLLPEPARDASGYRRYDAQAATDLIRIRTLAEAGVPLSRVGTLLQAGPEEFAAAVAEIDRDLRETVRRTQEHRRRVAALVSSDALGLPASVVGYLDTLREIGLSERGIRIERDGWIMLAVHSPDRVDGWIRLKHEGLKDPAYLAMYLSFDAAYDWADDDPRLPELADDMVAYYRRLTWAGDPTAPSGSDFDTETVALLDSHTMLAAPAWARLAELLQQRGMTGWTDMREAGS